MTWNCFENSNSCHFNQIPPVQGYGCSKSLYLKIGKIITYFFYDKNLKISPLFSIQSQRLILKKKLSSCRGWLVVLNIHKLILFTHIHCHFTACLPNHNIFLSLVLGHTVTCASFSFWAKECFSCEEIKQTKHNISVQWITNGQILLYSNRVINKAI